MSENAELAPRLLADLAPAAGAGLAAELAAGGDPGGALNGLHRLWEGDPEGLAAALGQPDTRRALLALAASGPFLGGLLATVPDALNRVAAGAAGEPFPFPEPDTLAAAADFADLQRGLRELKRRAFLHLAAGDLGRAPEADGGAALFTATEGLSRLAETALEAAARFCRAELAERHGDCLTGGGAPCPFVILGMGKLGAGELNYASDIDLVVFYGRGGEETAGPRPLSPTEFFARLTRRVLQAVGESTDLGRVFRVDLRLRPEGGSGAVAWSLGAATAYYETLGDTWERAAFIKARPVAGDREAGAAFLGEIAPFVFRRYLDFAALEGIRHVQGRIRARQRTRDAVGNDVKLGRGGIREVEFFVQAQQLIHGGKDPSLRAPRTLDALDALTAAGHVTAAERDSLRAAYLFLRDVEHRVQLVAEEQTHLLPSGPRARRRLACQMGHAGADSPWSAFSTAYLTHTEAVHRVSEGLFHHPEAAAPDAPFEAVAAELDHLPDDADLGFLNLREPRAGLERLRALGRHIEAPWQSEQSRARWLRLLPLFLADIASGEDPDLGLDGLTRFVEALRGRAIYAAMLYENPDARRLLARLFCASRYLSALLARHPALMDELLSPEAILPERRPEALAEDLARALSGRDEEGWLDAARRFKHREVVRVALREILTDMDEEARAAALARLAEALVRAALERTWEEMTARHGVPPAAGGGPGRVAVVGMGRLGSGEMGYGSDLDLIFIHDGEALDETPGPRRLSVAEFYARLGRRIVSKLTLPTGEGVLYEVDMRLRPSGSSGQLVTALSAFERYQREEAWTWEKQALTRARVVADTGGFAPEVEAALRAATYTPREPGPLAAEVVEMRARMDEHLTREPEGALDLKHGRGGIVDIEFVVQYLLLAHGHAHPEVVDPNPRAALARLRDAGLISETDAGELLSALSLYRTVEGYLQRVEGGADRLLGRGGPPLPGGRARLYGRVERARSRVAEVYARVLGASDR